MRSACAAVVFFTTLKGTDFMTKDIIGIVGFGHLGTSIAMSLLNRGFPKECLMISCRGSKATLERAEKFGLTGTLSDTKNLMAKADIIILAAKPQDVSSIYTNKIKNGALVMSFMAALPYDSLKKMFDCEVCRVMCSGPETITSGNGASVLWPQNTRADQVLECAGIKRFPISLEEEIDAFTVGICVPPILMNIAVAEKELKSALGAAAKQYPIMEKLTPWIETALGAGEREDNKACLENVCTKGGISEAMVKSLMAGNNFALSLKRGLDRCSEICEEIQKKICENAA